MFVVNGESQPGIRELIEINASNVYFSTLATVVPKFMKSDNAYQKFLFGRAKLFPETSTSSKGVKNRDVIGVSGFKQTREILVSDENTLSVERAMMHKDRKLTPIRNQDQLGSDSRIAGSGNVPSQNEALISNPNVPYIKKFAKFFDFLQKAIKKISKAARESSEKEAESLKSPLKGINITKHWSQIAENTSNIEGNEMKEMANDSENSRLIPMTTERSKIEKNLDKEIYGRIRDDKGFVVHTPIDSSKYKTAVSNKFYASFDTPFLQLDEKETVEEIKMTSYGKKESESSLEEYSSQDELEKNEEESEVVDGSGRELEDQSGSSDSEHPSKPEYKCNGQAETSNETTTQPLQETSTKFGKRLASDEGSLNETDSLGKDTSSPPLLQNVANESSILKMEEKPSTADDSLSFKHEEVEAKDDQGHEEKIPTKFVSLTESIEYETTNSTKVFNDMLSTTFPTVNEASVVPELKKSDNDNSGDYTETLSKLNENETVSQIPETFVTSFTPRMKSSASSAKASSSVGINRKFLTKLGQEDDGTILFSMDYEIKQEPQMEGKPGSPVESKAGKLRQAITAHLQNNDSSVEDAENLAALSDITSFMDSSGESKVVEQDNEEVGMVHRKRKKCSRHRHGCPRKCSDGDDVSVEVKVPTANAVQVFGFLKIV